MPRLDGATLHGDGVRLEPLAARHVEPLRALVASVDRSTFGFTTVPTVASVDGYVTGHVREAEAGRLAPFAQVEATSGRVVGHTAYCNARWIGDRLNTVEVGYTWLAPDAQAGWFNSASKLALFTHAFEAWQADRVELRTDARNARSRAAIAAVGGVLEGVLRGSGASHVPGEEGRARDTALFALVAADWPAARERLAARVAAKRATRR